MALGRHRSSWHSASKQFGYRISDSHLATTSAWTVKRAVVKTGLVGDILRARGALDPEFNAIRVRALSTNTNKAMRRNFKLANRCFRHGWGICRESSCFAGHDGEYAGKALVWLDRTILDYEGVQGVVLARNISRGTTRKMGKWFLAQTIQGTNAGKPI